MSVDVLYQTNITIKETLTTNIPAASAPLVTHNLFNVSQSLNSATTPPVTLCANFNKALSGGAGTIDLTALSGTNGAVQDGTGLKVQIARFAAPATNANPLTVTFGASNPYLLGGAAFKFILQPGMEIVVFGNDATPDVAGGAKNIDIAGTASQVVHVQLVLG